MYIVLKIMSTVPTCLKDMQDEMEKVIGYAFFTALKKETGITQKKRKFLWLKDLK